MGGFDEKTYAPNIHRTDANDLRTLAHSGYLLRSTLRLLDVATNDAGIGPQIDHCLGLNAADCASPSGHKHNPVLCTAPKCWVSRRRQDLGASLRQPGEPTEDALPPDIAQEI